MTLLEQLAEVIEAGNEEEKEVLQLALQAIMQKRERNSAYISGFMGLEGEFVEEGVYQFRLPITPFMVNRAGMVHGGISATLVDSTMGSLVNKSLPENKGAVTVEMKVNFLKPGWGEELICRAWIKNKGKKLISATAEIRDDQARLIVTAMGTFYVLD
ncbi:PaaI family thioesterase [Mechercharimyces sp. CAU 1602]|uniref:PaaI family thioesterase n=1 Tax=Mechercharimyces sp. CAU 1602 TaxID=2973933 RepID=UPI0021617812|nr:PaaI family thioesterase [Mechercharimyces sp. CAU 1602]MCS1350137.1 PaaI family thioesterase [Mechercharimyces sp. CAU 1602]